MASVSYEDVSKGKVDLAAQRDVEIPPADTSWLLSFNVALQDLPLKPFAFVSTANEGYEAYWLYNVAHRLPTRK